MKKLVVLDIEVLPNYFLVAFKGVESKKLYTIEMYGENACLTQTQRSKLHSIMSDYTTFGFNSVKYDLPMINYALCKGTTCKQLHSTSKDIIEKNQPDWMTYRNLDIEPRNFDHFDISEPSPAVMISLKNYGTRVGSKKLWEFFVDPHEPIDKATQIKMKEYCENDLDVTLDLYHAISDRIDLRISMGERYGLDLRSKSDAQIAEAVITSELRKRGIDTTKPSVPPTYRARYKAPEFISFSTVGLGDLVAMIEDIPFVLAANGQVKMPTQLANQKIKIGNTTYKMGIGGLHSQEKSISVLSNDTHVMRNADFTSYYPFIILNLELFPKHLSGKFLGVYGGIIHDRVSAKQKVAELKMELKDTKTQRLCMRTVEEIRSEIDHYQNIADSLKIVANGSFGKFGSKYSKLYSPDLLLATTITGQLTLLMLIERLEANGIQVVSANTDGLEYYCRRDLVPLAEAIIFDLELETGFEMEHGEYKALYARDVNNYVAVYDGYTKAKGVYTEPSLSKGRQTPIVFKAVREFLLNNTKLHHTIVGCYDINMFVSARTVKGGGVYDGEYLGKMVRWYYSTKSKGPITYKLNGNKVPKTDGCKPMMDLTDRIPVDLDYKWYIDEAVSALKDLGVTYDN